MFAARCLRTGAEVALRRLPEGVGAGAEAADSLRGQVARLAALADAAVAGPAVAAHLLHVRDAARAVDGRWWLVADLATGGDLTRLLRPGPLDTARLRTLGVPLVTALLALHGQQIAHGAVAPGNVLLTGDGRPLLADLGVAALAGVGPVPGTDPAAVMAPSAQDDAYAVAAVLAYAHTGEVSEQALSRLRGRLGRALAAALASRPGERPPLEALLDELRRGAVAPLRPPAAASPHGGAPPGRRLGTPPARESVQRRDVGTSPHPAASPAGRPDARTAPERGTELGIVAELRAGAQAATGRRPRAGTTPIRLRTRSGVVRLPSLPRPVAASAGRRVDGAGGTAGHAHRLRSAAVAAVAAVLLAVAAFAARAAVVGGDGRGPARDPAQAVVRASAAPTGGARSPTTGGASGAGAGGASAPWATVLAALDARRSAALEEASPARLAEVDAPGSAALSADLAALRSMARSGLRARGLSTQVRGLRLLEAGAGRARLEVVDTRSAYALVDAAGRVAVRRPERGPRRWRVDLVHGQRGWRVLQVGAVAG